MSKSINEYIKDRLPHMVKKIRQEVEAAAKQDADVIRSSVYNDDFVPDKSDSIIVSCQLDCYRPLNSLQWRETYLYELRKIFWDEGVMITRVDFSTYHKGEKRCTEMEVFFTLRSS